MRTNVRLGGGFYKKLSSFLGKNVKECNIFLLLFLAFLIISGFSLTSYALFTRNVSGTNSIKMVVGSTRSVLVAGDVFSKSVKDLVNGTTDATYKSTDTKITYIGFYEKDLPDGFTKETLESLPNVSVSSDNNTKAYNDNGKVYIYSDRDIVANASMYSMFRNMTSLTSIDLLKLDTSNVTSMKSTFHGLSNLTTLDLSKFNTSNVTIMEYMFDGMSSLKTLDISSFDTQKTIYMDYMFQSVSSLTTLDLNHFNTSNVTHMGAMFRNMNSLSILNIDNFNTSNVTNMSAMFANCYGLTVLDLSHFNISKVTNMEYMFHGAYYLTTLDVSNFNTLNVNNMESMFYQLSSLTSLDLSSFNTTNVTNMTNMFVNSINLETIHVSDLWSVANTTSSTYMFNGCKKLVGGNGTKYDASYTDKTYARVDKTGEPGYLTYKEYVAS